MYEGTASKQLCSLWYVYHLSSAKIILVKTLALSAFGREDERVFLVSGCKCPHSLLE